MPSLRVATLSAAQPRPILGANGSSFWLKRPPKGCGQRLRKPAWRLLSASFFFYFLFFFYFFFLSHGLASAAPTDAQGTQHDHWPIAESQHILPPSLARLLSSFFHFTYSLLLLPRHRSLLVTTGLHAPRPWVHGHGIRGMLRLACGLGMPRTSVGLHVLDVLDEDFGASPSKG